MILIITEENIRNQNNKSDGNKMAKIIGKTFNCIRNNPIKLENRLPLAQKILENNNIQQVIISANLALDLLKSYYK